GGRVVFPNPIGCFFPSPLPSSRAAWPPADVGPRAGATAAATLSSAVPAPRGARRGGCEAATAPRLQTAAPRGQGRWVPEGPGGGALRARRTGLGVPGALGGPRWRPGRLQGNRAAQGGRGEQPGSSDPRRSQPVNLNHYATKKSVAESMLDVALFMSNAMRLKAVLEQGPSSHYYITLVTLLSLSLLLQVAIGVLLVVIARLNLNEVEKQWRLDQLNNVATVLVFFTVVINVFITAFGAHKTGFLTARASRNPL
uniref:Ninjurin 2 n=1 Tax=Theropithecus gelada TaxID=9565 RepID=A0A8D2FUC9_THEGE